MNRPAQTPAPVRPPECEDEACGHADCILREEEYRAARAARKRDQQTWARYVEWIAKSATEAA